MNLSVGIIGLPNAGKSTLFNALLKKRVAFAANYPFATIEPNVGVVPVPDGRLPVIAKLVNTTKIVPATVKFTDIAGLVSGAHSGEGLGNQFLAHIREADLICHVLRSFSDPSVVHVAGNVNADRDKEIIETELIMADLQTLERQTEPFGFAQGKPQGKSTKEDFQRWETILKLKKDLNQGIPARDTITDEKEAELIYDLHLLTLKPVLYVLNVGENEIKSQLAISNLQKENVVIISAKIESELANLPELEQTEYLKSLNLEKSGLERLIQTAYRKLDLISFLTGGELEARAWTIKQGTRAPQAAGVIHTDFEKHFIKAEVISFQEFVKTGGWVNARNSGKVRLEGKEYIISDGDVIDFKIGI